MHNPNALRAGSVVKDYRVEAVLGYGGFGITYRARDLRLDSLVAVKEYFPASLAMRMPDQTVASRPDGVAGGYAWGLEKFMNEAATLAKMTHGNIVGVNHLFHGNGTAYMALDYVDGPNLKSWLRSIKRWPEQAELDALFYPLLNALKVVHDKGLLHRDIAPKNIMVAAGLSPILIDFGAARQLVAQRSQTFAALLTPGYAPFEQYVATGQGQGPWTDIYSLAATFYEAIAGQTPPEAPDRALEDRCVSAVVLCRGRYRQDFLETLDWGLRPMPKDRPQSIPALLRALQGNSGPPSVGGPGATSKSARKSWMSNWFGKG